MKKLSAAAILLAATAFSVQAKENIGQERVVRPGRDNARIYAGCTDSKGRADLDVNNVRTPIYINGDMWWDLVGNAEYEIPAGSHHYSLFSGAIWIGGKDGAGNLKVAAQTYRQSGSDFWPGPVDTTNATITNDVCQQYDRHWKITLTEVKDFVNYFAEHGGDLSGYPVPEVIKTWPGNGDPSKNQGRFLAPFEDVNSDGIYNYEDGDYPKFNLSPVAQCGEYLLGDQTIWWVFNDVGNIHKETGSTFSIGVEIQAQAFGFNTNDEINNMTFYKYKIINRASQVLSQTYFGAWIDPDLGNAFDDYVGCDVKRGLGYCYNGDADDDGALGYGLNPPAVGVDFFEGPLADPNDGIDNDRDSIVDEPGEQIIMAKFVYYNNDFSNIGNPSTTQHYYNYMRGIWKDGSPLVYGGTGYQTSGADSCDFMFPGDSDPNHWGTKGINPGFDWSEVNPLPGAPPNQPDDRRFLQSSGPFTLQPGAINFITTGAVWARTSSGGPVASVKLVRLADDKAQILFDNCFKIVDGPDAPSMTIRELDKELILSIINPVGSNNYKEQYREKDPAVTGSQSYFTFEGYKVYQLANGSVATTDLNNADKARLIAQCDIQNGVAQIINQYFQPDLNAFLPVEEVNGADKGLRHTFRVTTDAFATGDAGLVNHKTYYFMVVAYAYNPDESIFDPYVEGLGKPYLQGRRGSGGGAVEVYTAIPHNPAPEADGLVLNTMYGDGPEITRVNGVGNGYIIGSDRKTMDIKQSQINEVIFSQGLSALPYPTYDRARGPVDIRIYDPLKVPSADFDLWFTDTVTSSGRWVLKNNVTGETDSSEKTLEFPYDQLFPKYGFSISATQVPGPGDYQAGGNGFAEGNRIFGDNNKRWLTAIADQDNIGSFNWILSGTNTSTSPSDWQNIDNSEFYEKVIGGTYAPYRLVRYQIDTNGIVPAAYWDGGLSQRNGDEIFHLLPSVDIVYTPDKSKWSRCVVFEAGMKLTKAEGRQVQDLIRLHPSWDALSNSYSTVDSGYSYFPGYAINVETGERLNIAFSEESYLCPDSGFAGQTGADMKWNPTSTLFNDEGRFIGGGKHWIYVFGNTQLVRPATSTDTSHTTAYDGCQYIHDQLWGIPNTNGTISGTNKVKIREVWKNCIWVSTPILAAGQELLSTDVRVRLRVARPYRQLQFDANYNWNNYYPYYKFSTSSLVGKTNQLETAKSALDLINVVPNPYYAYSGYETNQLDNRVKIVNLPSKCTVSIYTPNGLLIRKYKRDVGNDNTDGSIFPDFNQETALDWDLKNSAGVPIAGGMYIIHVEAPGIGEKTIKWFGVLRPLDLDTF